MTNASATDPGGANGTAPREIEIKLRATDLAAVRQSLKQAGARFLETVEELNEFFDRPNNSLRTADSGLRIRTLRRGGTSADEALLTWKGPLQPGAMHNRPSIDLAARPAALASGFLFALGFIRTSGFEKRRESWEFDACRVELDELPHFGAFVEIEGPDEATVLQVRAQLGLTDLEIVPQTYHAMVAGYLRAKPSADNTLRF